MSNSDNQKAFLQSLREGPEAPGAWDTSSPEWRNMEAMRYFRENPTEWSIDYIPPSPLPTTPQEAQMEVALPALQAGRWTDPIAAGSAEIGKLFGMSPEDTEALEVAIGSVSPLPGEIAQGAKTASMLFGGIAGRRAFARAAQMARKMYPVGSPARTAMAKSVGRGGVLSPQPLESPLSRLGMDPSGTYLAYAGPQTLQQAADESMLRIAHLERQQKRFEGFVASARKDLEEALSRGDSLQAPLARQSIKDRQAVVDELADSIKLEKELQARHLERAKVMMKRERIQEKGWPAHIAARPGQKAEFHEYAGHGMWSEMPQDVREEAFDIIKKSGLKDWMAKKPETFPKEWREIPEEQATWVLENLSKGWYPPGITPEEIDQFLAVIGARRPW